MTELKQQALFSLDYVGNTDLIKSVSYDQEKILSWIIALYCPNGFELDPTYSVGNFYKRIPKPKYRYDINPQVTGVIQSDCCHLPHENESISSINFDPPFIVGTPAEGVDSTSIIANRFSRFKNIAELLAFYKSALAEFHRILKMNGVLVFKCQDTVSSNRQYLSHVEIINYATSLGFYPVDLFVLIAKNRIIGETHNNQKHCRKFHSYFIVFRKEASLNGGKET